MKKIGIILSLIVLMSLVGCDDVKKKQIDNFSFVTETFSCVGVYSGEVYKGNPLGVGTFVTSNSPRGEFTCTGNWSYGKLNGEGEIRYSNGIIVKGTFVDNELDGEVKVLFNDGKYAIYQYTKGTPYGLVCIYDDNNKLVKKDWYYEGESVNVLIENAITPTYSELINDMYSYVNSIIRVEGKIKEIDETDTNIKMEIVTEDDHKYIFSYTNSDINVIKQCIAPNFRVDDRVVFYGKYEGIGKIKTPHLQGVYGEYIYTDKLLEEENSYNDIRNNPYYYGWHECTVLGDLEFYKETNGYYYSKLVDKDNNVFYIRTSYKLKEDENVEIKGVYFGNYKKYNSKKEQYTYYPIVLLEEYNEYYGDKG